MFVAVGPELIFIAVTVGSFVETLIVRFMNFCGSCICCYACNRALIVYLQSFLTEGPGV